MTYVVIVGAMQGHSPQYQSRLLNMSASTLILSITQNLILEKYEIINLPLHCLAG